MTDDSIRSRPRRQRPRPGRALLPRALLILSLAAPSLVAQERQEALNLAWWHPVAAGAGVATLYLLDDPVRRWLQPPESSLDGLADLAADFKNPEVFFVTGGGAIALGLITGRPKVTVTGMHVLTAYGVAGWINIGTKWAFGRSRPSQTPGDVTNFSWFDGGESSAFPSGSSAVVFSLAATLADAIDRRSVSVLLYGGAALNAWARLHENRHWLSDVAMGALVGITSAKLVNGEWTVFGLRPPVVWTDGRSTTLELGLGL